MITFTLQPQNEAVVIGEDVTLSVAATGNGSVTYQWKKDGQDIEGETSETLTIAYFSEADRGSYTCEATDDEETLESDAAVLTVMPEITVQPVDVVGNVGSPTSLSVTAAAGTLPIIYQWKKDGIDIEGETNDTLAIASFTTAEGGLYTVEVTADGNTVESAVASISCLPEFTVNPINVSALYGSDVQFSAIAIGFPPPTYQWKHDTVPIKGAVANSVLLRDVTDQDAGLYECVATNAIGSENSLRASLVIADAGKTDHKEFGTRKIQNNINRFTETEDKGAVRTVKVNPDFILVEKSENFGPVFEDVYSRATKVRVDSRTVRIDSAVNRTWLDSFSND